jgi:hypothetical protein
MLAIIFVAAAIIGFALHLALGKQPRTRARIVELLLLYLLVVNIGLGGLLGWLGHTFTPDEIALKIGWPTGSPFQFEVAVANLGWGVCGVLCLWFGQGFRTATGIGSSVFLLGCAYGHIRDIIQHGNFGLYNAGPVLWIGDLAVPITILILLALRYRFAEKTS